MGWGQWSSCLVQSESELLVDWPVGRKNTFKKFPRIQASESIWQIFLEHLLCAGGREGRREKFQSDKAPEWTDCQTRVYVTHRQLVAP